MKNRTWLSILVVGAVVSLSAMWFVTHYLLQPSEIGFGVYLSENNALVISDPDILCYNWTSQEITLTAECTQRLEKMGNNLYNFSGFVMKIDGEQVYSGVFRSPFMSALPSPPRIAVLFPSYAENDRVMRMFFPSFQPPSDYPTEDMRIFQHFEKTSKLVN